MYEYSSIKAILTAQTQFLFHQAPITDVQMEAA